MIRHSIDYIVLNAKLLIAFFPFTCTKGYLSPPPTPRFYSRFYVSSLRLDADITVSGPTNLVVDCGCQNLTAFTADSSATTPKLSIALPAMVWAIMTVIVCMVYLSVSEP